MKNSSKVSFFILVIAFTILACVSNSTTVTTPVTVDVEDQSNNDTVNNTAQNDSVVQEQEPQEEAPLVEPTSPPEPTTLPAQVSTEVTVSNYFISYDYLYIIGIVKNTGNVPVDFVKVVAALRDDNNTLVSSEYSYTSLDVIPPGESSPFSVVFFENPEGWSSYDLTVQANESDWMEAYTDFEILSHNGKPGSFADYEIVGEVKNIGSSRATFVEIVAALFDADGNIIGVDFTYTDLDIVDPEGTSPFSLSVLSTAEGEVDSYQLWVEASTE